MGREKSVFVIPFAIFGLFVLGAQSNVGRRKFTCSMILLSGRTCTQAMRRKWKHFAVKGSQRANCSLDSLDHCLQKKKRRSKQIRMIHWCIQIRNWASTWYSLSSLKLAIITQTAAIIAANPRTKPTKIQMRAPRASMQPPLNAASPFIYGKNASLRCIWRLIRWISWATNLCLGDWIHHN